MSDAIARATVTLRPLRIAFLCPPSDRGAVLQAIQISSSLWGGTYNVLVPAYQRRPTKWADGPIAAPSPDDIVSGYLDNFDADAVVSLSAALPAKRFTSRGQRAIELPDLLGSLHNDAPHSGLGMVEVLEWVWQSEFKYVRKDDLHVVLPSHSRAYYTFLAATTGSWPSAVLSAIKHRFTDRIPLRPAQTSLAKMRAFDANNSSSMTPLDLTEFGIERVRRGRLMDGLLLFVMDASSPLDILDFWNLRAAGCDIVPIPVQALTADSAVTILDQLSLESWKHVTLQKGRDVSKSEFETVRGRLRKAIDRAPRASARTWFPRMWDEWARARDGVDVGLVEAQSTEQSFDRVPEILTVTALSPPTLFDNLTGAIRYANTLELHTYGTSQEPVAEVFPSQGKLSSALGLHPEDWRAGRHGLVRLYRGAASTTHLIVPNAETVFLAFLRENGLDCETSQPGRVAKRLLHAIGGSWGVETFAIPGMVPLLSRLSGGRYVGHTELWGALQEVCNRADKDPLRVFETLTRSGLIRLGLAVSCATCRRRSWYELSTIQRPLVCTSCLATFEIPEHSPESLVWAYSGLGPLSSRNAADGAFTVLLTHRFFSRVLGGSTTPAPSFALQDRSAEFDCGLLFQKHWFGRSRRDVIVLECKTHDEFSRADIQKLAAICRRLPGAVVGLATLRDRLTEAEKRLIRPLAKRGRKPHSANRGRNPLLILTGTELCAQGSLRMAWGTLTDQRASWSQRPELDRLAPLCDATQQLYLDMEPWTTDLMRSLDVGRA